MKRKYGHLHKSFCGIGVALICFLMLLPFLPFLPVGAQPTPPSDSGREPEVDMKIRLFFEALKGNSTSTFEELLRHSPYDSFDTRQTLPELRKKIEELLLNYGGILNYERYDTKRIGEDLVLSRYILKCENGPIVWTFAFYRKPAATTTSITGSNTWMFQQLHFDTDLRSLL